ncbi:DNA-binding transcriptional regulator, MarR family [Aliiroseovarius halocynthiae]|uniref:Winged helix-turn-helix transcriptional regulator n=1 Tax=Aliiroseovarius halocynthiae TaxID=985055 RepID=A0A545SZL6_9RHOB|nr:MarR family winged helix-turn-helix transcriptional regulator [Aliiroseovarius halocynthiae]TQV70415.1 winged helix-turn-helix transcriptional regulator [Aliiroseovarius halocynthiae]SMR81869.1 DNA-binding transcriptional regulator, MarR family [Aliiroseovarius halocynthiae]
MTSFKLDDFLPYQIAVLSSRVSAEFSKHYREAYGISVSEWRVVAHLSQADSVSVREIHKRVDMDKPKVSRAASRLEAAGYITKTINPSDRRLVELSLTDKGRAMIDALAPIAADYETHLTTLLEEQDESFRETLVLLLKKLDPGNTNDE